MFLNFQKKTTFIAIVIVAFLVLVVRYYHSSNLMSENIDKSALEQTSGETDVSDKTAKIQDLKNIEVSNATNKIGDNEISIVSDKEEPDNTESRIFLKRKPGESREDYKRRLREANKQRRPVQDLKHEERRLAIKNGDWPEYLAIIDEINGTHNLSAPMLSRSLGLAIIHDAPIWVFQSLLERGTSFNYLHLSLLASENKLALLMELENIGLNIHMESPDGRNGVFYAMQFFTAYETFEYLLNRGVSTSLLVEDQDYLDYALTGAENAAQACPFVVRLLEIGNFKVISKHTEQLKRLKSVNLNNFNCIMNNSSQYWNF